MQSPDTWEHWQSRPWPGTAVAEPEGMRFIPSLASLALVVGAAGCVLETTDSSILVSNRSDFEIHEMYVTPVASSTWGPNLLGVGDVLMPGDSISVGLECGTYDAM